jgi:hypothetical protein
VRVDLPEVAPFEQFGYAEAVCRYVVDRRVVRVLQARGVERAYE